MFRVGREAPDSNRRAGRQEVVFGVPMVNHRGAAGSAPRVSVRDRSSWIAAFPTHSFPQMLTFELEYEHNSRRLKPREMKIFPGNYGSVSGLFLRELSGLRLSLTASRPLRGKAARRAVALFHADFFFLLPEAMLM